MDGIPTKAVSEKGHCYHQPGRHFTPPPSPALIPRGEFIDYKTSTITD